MIINHLILGVQNLEESLNFYTLTLDYKLKRYFTDTGTNETGAVLAKINSPDLLLVPFSKERLPSPQHIAFEVLENEFYQIHHQIEKMGLYIRSMPSLSSKETGIGKTVDDGKTYNRFFFVDPNNINLEIMQLIDSDEGDSNV